ncbi:MAG: LysR family transcriptional regulator [Lamprobacter sp.]|uniref:LysR family transcriptional regulator n=1 Tax=Lamprobacter sp. TaxID=3100796 RepID=UPI002B26431B|nr:LysR family transcriptional regulator [Lamprobacter sp.]MEA3641385.1 LysR family transcriptional regulator [Lamprobacter sp.]
MTDFDTLRALLALRAQGNLTAAAQALGCPKSTLSRRLATLEDALGQRLTRQASGRLMLSDAGVVYASYAERMLELADEARRSLEMLSTDMRGALTVWLDHQLARGWTTRVLNDFLAVHPEVTLSARVVSPDALPEAESNDLWLSCDQRMLPQLKRIALGRWQRRLYTAAAEQGQCCLLDDPSALEDCPWLTMAGEPDRISLRHSKRGDVYRIQPGARMTVDSQWMLADAIARGYGIGMLPGWVAECPRHGFRGQFQRVLADWEGDATVVFLHVPCGPRPCRVHALIEHIKDRLPRRWAL